MCGRYVASTPTAVLADWFDVDEVAVEPDPSWNVAPTDPVPAIVTRRDGPRRLGLLRWGLVPSWSRDPGGAARSETLLGKPAFRSAFARRRCLLPADGFYEWERPARRAWFIHAPDRTPLAMAGLWEVWHGSGGEVLRTCSVITTAANALLAPLHDRMPVFLHRSDWGTWLDPANDDVDSLASLLVPAPEEMLTLHRVGPLVNSVRNNGPELIDPDGGGAGVLL
jgi:putative SOS response-associated peptidase YedK